MIVVEGPDGSGKSTIARKIARALQLQHMHEGGPPVSDENLRWRLNKHYENFGAILDRTGWVSERVYGPIIRGTTFIPMDELDEWADRFIAAGWRLVYCRRSLKKLVEFATADLQQITATKDYKDSKHAEKVATRIRHIAIRYQSVITELEGRGLKVVRYCMDNPNGERAVEEVIRRVRP